MVYVPGSLHLEQLVGADTAHEESDAGFGGNRNRLTLCQGRFPVWLQGSLRFLEGVIEVVVGSAAPRRSGRPRRRRER